MAGERWKRDEGRREDKGGRQEGEIVIAGKGRGEESGKKRREKGA